MKLTDENEHDLEDIPFDDLVQRVGDEDNGDARTWLEEEAVPDDQQIDEDILNTFEEQEVAEVDNLWDRIENEAGQAASRVGSSEGDTTVVSKTDYCAGCPHLSDPIEMQCTHETAEILALVDVEHVRVRNCPVVDERDVFNELK